MRSFRLGVVLAMVASPVLGRGVSGGDCTTLADTVKELQSEIGELRFDLHAQSNLLDAVTHALSTTSGEARTYTFDRPVRDPQEMKNSTSGECDSGFYVSGVTLIFNNESEAKGTDSGISHVQITCRKLGLP